MLLRSVSVFEGMANRYGLAICPTGTVVAMQTPSASCYGRPLSAEQLISKPRTQPHRFDPHCTSSDLGAVFGDEFVVLHRDQFRYSYYGANSFLRQRRLSIT